MIWPKVLEYIDMLMEVNMLVIGIKINNMALEKKNGMTEVNIKDFILMLLKKDMENIVGQTEIDT
jgi:hypothetical protein